jgi:endonuclease YncB( thermonuclease family)
MASMRQRATRAALNGAGKLYPCGEVANAALLKFIAGRTVFCTDVGPDRKYTSRRIGQCYVDGTDLNHWLVENGWAINFEPYGTFRAGPSRLAI